MPEMTENETPSKKRHRKKNRETHNAVERHRKKKIHSGIKRIGELIPCSPTLKQSQNMILDQALKYINELKRQNDELLLNGGEKEQADEILRLRKQLDDIQKENGRYIDLLKANDICLYDDPSIHWRGHLKNAKVPLIISTNEGQKNIIVYSNGSPLGVNNQSVSFNVSQNLQKQTANVAPVQRTCNLLTPVTTASVNPTENKMCPQTTVCASTSQQHVPLCLPVTISAQTVLEISTSEGEPTIFHSATTNLPEVFQSGTDNQLEFGSSSTTQSNQNDSDSTIGQQNVGLSESVISHIASVSLTSPDLPHEVPSTSLSCSGFLQSFVGTITNATCAQPTRVTVSGHFTSVNNDLIGEVTQKVRSVAASSGVETIVTSAPPVTSMPSVTTISSVTSMSLLTSASPVKPSALPVTCMDSGWSLPSSLPLSGMTSDLRNVSSLTRIPSTGNTQTTWTTLQVSGNTIQPLSHTSHKVMPVLLNEQVHCPGSLPLTSGLQSVTGISLNALRVEGPPVEQVAVTLPSFPSLPVQPLVSPSPLKPKTAKNIVPLNSAMQVIQVASPLGSAVTPAQANQNVIILQPPNPTPCPPVMRAEIPTQTVGQQIVIIQTAPNPNPLPLISAQPPGPTRMPIHGASPIVCTHTSVQNSPTPQTFGGKHLVHILPRPSPSSSASTSTQSFSVAMSNQQQPPTISLNGQLFSLQPMVSSSSNQTSMQFIPPTTSEDPNTNVALNTFGALTSLNQSISQMAGQSCLQLPLIPATNTPPDASSAITPAHCISLSTASASPVPAENVTVLQNTSNPVKPLASLSSNSKSKRIRKKPSTKKHSATSKEVPQVIKAADSARFDPTRVEAGRVTQLESTSMSPAQCTKNIAATGTVGVFNRDANESRNSEQLVEIRSEGELNVSPVQSSLISKSTEEQFVLATSVCKDPTPLAEKTCAPQMDPPTSSVSSECVTMIYSASSSAVQHISAGYVSEASTDHNSLSIGCVSEEVSTSEPDMSKQDSSNIMQVASDLLEGQGLGRMLYDIAKEKTSASKRTSLAPNEQHPFSTANSKSIDSDVGLPGRLMNTDGEILNHEHACVSEQEPVICSSSVSTRQADSPMSTSSGSNRSFSVASMLPDTAREDVTNSTVLAPTFNVGTPSEQTDMVAHAARAVFDQGSHQNRKSSIQMDVREAATKSANDAPLEGNGHQSFTQICKDNHRVPFETPPDKKHSHDPRPKTNAVGPVEKPSCSLGLEASSFSVQSSTSQSQNSASLSINNLIQPGGVNHPFVSCSNVSQPSEQIAATAAVNLPRPSVYYDTQSPAPAVSSEYSQEQFHAIRATAMQAPQTQEASQKQNRESRKESGKRNIPEDHLISTAKRQKQCEATSIRHDRMPPMSGTSDDLVEQAHMLVSQIPYNSSNSAVSVSSHGPTNSFNTIFPTNVTFVNSALRQTDIRCNSQPLLVEQPPQQGQAHNPHLQQRVTSQTVTQLHNSNPYLKQQQVGQLRERHHMYQQQHIPHAEGSIHSQSHNVHQQRVIQQDVQMQKKRNLVLGGQATQLSLQQKHQGSEQGRQKGNQTHPHHHQQMQQQQQIQQHFTAPPAEKSCDIPASNRNHHGTHQQNHLNSDIMHQQDVGNRQQGSGASSEHVSTHNQLQRLMTSRSLEQHMVSQPSIVSRQSNMTCTPHRQERNRVSSYSAEALIGKTSSNSEQRMGISIQGPRVPDQLEMRTYLDVSRNKGLSMHNMQSRMSVEHAVSAEVQRLSDCQSYKPGGSNQQPTGTFDVQTSRNSEMGNAISSLRVMQSQAFRIGQNPGPALDRQKRLPYVSVQGIPIGNPMPPRDGENSCHQNFMQSLLGPHLGEQVVGSQRLISEHQRNTQCGPSTALEYSCPPGRESVHLRRDSESQNRESCDMSMGVINTRNNSLSIPFSSSSSSGEVQGRNTSPHISIQKSNTMRMTDSQGSKSHPMTNVSTSMHGIARPSHPAISHGNVDQGQTSARQSNPPGTQRSRHPLQDNGGSKVRQPERTRSSNQRHGNVFDPNLPHLPLAASSSMILGRQPSSADKRASIVRFMSDGSQLPNDNTAPDQHTLSQNFGFPFIPDGGMNPTINANTSFIPPVTQASATRTPALIPVDSQNTLPSFYPPYSPAHPSLSNDLSIPYFSNQMFTNPGTEKPNSTSLNNRFGSILSPPRPVGFAQPSFPLLPDMPPMHMANPSHLSNFNLTSLFPEIATALPPDGSAMSPLLSIVNSSASDSSKQSSNRPAHNISHILGHDCSSAV